jgi:hypothetical protein
LIYVAYSGATYSADSVAAKYPYQSTAHVQNFTEKIESFLKTEYPRVAIIDFSMSVMMLFQTTAVQMDFTCYPTLILLKPWLSSI